MTTRPQVVDVVDLDTMAPIPTTVESLESFVQRSRRMLCDYQFPPREIDTVIAILRDAKATGQLVVDFSQGTACNVRFRQEEKITPP